MPTEMKPLKLCAREGCENMHSRRGIYCCKDCANVAWKKAHSAKVAEHRRSWKLKAEEEAKKRVKRDWKREILACRANDGSCRYVGKMKESESCN